MIRARPLGVVGVAIGALVVLVGVAGIDGPRTGGGVLQTSPDATGTDESTGVVAYVLDGDTVQVTTAAGEARVRLLGISAPEIARHGEPGECYGQPATRHLEQLLPAGTEVRLVSDPTQDQVDRYGRWLRYVETPSRDVGRAQVRSGSAIARDSSTPVTRIEDYERAEAAARQRGAGMWTACE